MFGFEIGDGWFPIIKGLCTSIQNHIASNRKDIEDAKKHNAIVESGEKPSWWNENMSEPTKRKVPRKIPQPKVLQIKEKFGTLRVYLTNSNTFIEAAIYMAEVMSSIMCEECGGNTQTNYDSGWAYTRCQSCVSRQGEQ